MSIKEEIEQISNRLRELEEEINTILIRGVSDPGYLAYLNREYDILYNDELIPILNYLDDEFHDDED